MNHSAVYMKTDKGLIEIATRQHRLPSRSRALLIMIDGKRTAIDVMASSSSGAEAEIYFEQLIADGFVYEAGADAPAAPPPRLVDNPEMLAPDALLELKKYVMQILRDVLGR